MGLAGRSLRGRRPPRPSFWPSTFFGPKNLHIRHIYISARPRSAAGWPSAYRPSALFRLTYLHIYILAAPAGTIGRPGASRLAAGRAGPSILRNLRYAITPPVMQRPRLEPSGWRSSPARAGWRSSHRAGARAIGLGLEPSGSGSSRRAGARAQSIWPWPGRSGALGLAKRPRPRPDNLSPDNLSPDNLSVFT